MASYSLPQFIVITSNANPKLYASYKKENNFITTIELKEASIFSDLVKIEVQQSTINPKYVNLLYPVAASTNKYWHEAANGIISAISHKPQEDTSRVQSTLFEVTKAADVAAPADGTFYFHLTHVQSGRRLALDPTSLQFKIASASASPDQTVLACKDWSALVKLPEHVAFRDARYGGMFIQHRSEVLDNNRSYLVFQREDPYSGWHSMRKEGEDPYVYDQLTENKVTLLPDGHIRIKSDFNGKLWRRAPDDYIMADGDPETPLSDLDYLFWPVKVDDQTIALRNAGNNKYCQLWTRGYHNALSAGASSIVEEAKLQVKEMVSKRKIYNVRFRTKEGRVYGQQPYEGGTLTLTNPEDVEADVEVVEFMYELGDEYYFFNKRFFVEAGVATTMDVGIPQIDASGRIEVNPGLDMRMVDLKLGTRSGVTRRAEVTGSVAVPPKSKVDVSYMGMQASFEVPFSYTQQDTSYVDGGVTEIEKDDGIYMGTNCYDYKFFTTKIHPL